MYFTKDNTYNEIRDKSLNQWLKELEKHDDVAVRGGVKLAQEYIQYLKEENKHLQEENELKNTYLKKMSQRKQTRTYPVVTLCGSTRFKKEFEQIQKKLTLEGCIVISVGLFGHSGDEEVWENMPENTLTETKKMLDDMHKRKIDMAERIFVINPGGYIGESTWSEICYACRTQKKIGSLEPIDINLIKEKMEKMR